MTLRGSALISAATSPRACSTSLRAARPSPCTEEGLPHKSSAARAASRAAGRSGAVAFQSRYTRAVIDSRFVRSTLPKDLLFAHDIVQTGPAATILWGPHGEAVPEIRIVLKSYARTPIPSSAP